MAVQKLPKKYLIRATCFLAALLWLTGCATPAAYRDPITKYQLASTVVIESARIEYASANERERAAEIAKAVQRQGQLNLGMLNGKDMRVISSEDIAARMAALNALAKHGQLLLALASSDAPEKSRAAANSLGAAIADLQLSLDSASKGDFKSKATGFSAIAGEIVRLSLEKKIADALNKSIVSSEEDVQALITLIRADMGDLYERRRAVLSNERSVAIDRYRDALEQSPTDRKELQEAADAILDTEKRWDQLSLLQGTAPSLDSMAQAHQTLVNYAKSDKTPQDFSDLVEAIEAFVERASIIANSIRMIKSD